MGNLSFRHSNELKINVNFYRKLRYVLPELQKRCKERKTRESVKFSRFFDSRSPRGTPWARSRRNCSSSWNTNGAETSSVRDFRSSDRSPRLMSTIPRSQRAKLAPIWCVYPAPSAKEPRFASRELRATVSPTLFNNHQSPGARLFSNVITIITD